MTAGGAGAPNFTSISGLAGALTVTSTTRYTACPGNSASQGCVVGALIAPGALSTLTAPLAPPGTQLTPALNQLDLSIGKRIIIGRFKIDPKLDIFNALNSDDYFTARSTTYTLDGNRCDADRGERFERLATCCLAASSRAGCSASARW